MPVSSSYGRYNALSTTYSTSYSGTPSYQRASSGNRKSSLSNGYVSPSSNISTYRTRQLPPGPGPLDHHGRKISSFNVTNGTSTLDTRRNRTPNGVTGRLGPLKADHTSSFASTTSRYQPETSTTSRYGTYSHPLPPSKRPSILNNGGKIGDDFSSSRPVSGTTRARKSSSLIDLSDLNLGDTNSSSNRNRGSSVYNDRNHSPHGAGSPSSRIGSNLRDNNNNDEIFGRASRVSHLDGERPDGTSRTRYTPSMSRETSPHGSRRAGVIAGEREYGESPTKSSLSYQSSSSSNGTSKHKDGGKVGLRNLGNTCFMNSVLQCLSNTRLLLEFCLDGKYEDYINTTTSNMKGALIKAYANLMVQMWKEKGETSVSPNAFKTQIQKFAPRFMGYSQQDSQEFLRYLLEGLHEDVNRVKKKQPAIILDDDQLDKKNDNDKAKDYWNAYLNRDNSMIVDIFVGQLKSELKFSSCGHISVTFDPYWDLSLSIPKNRHEVSLEDCFKLFMKEEELAAEERPMCAKCKSRRSCTKSFSIQRFPKILVLHLKRFSQERFGRKLSSMVDFPIKGLDLTDYSSDRGSRRGRVLYDLYAVSNHSGGTSSGHYTAYCKNPYSGEWNNFSDARVSRVQSNQVVSPEAYVLFYELRSTSE